tara:strand:+ start:460 stop:1044 length:585 start_codon:yes stop_codon:yes gene_type:complete
MSKWVLVDDATENVNNVKNTWKNSQTPSGKISATGDTEYVNLWKEHFPNFSGKILEIGAGNGFLAKNILQLNENIDYTILDLEAHFNLIKSNVGSNVKFIKSSEYEAAFNQEWDLLIETHCLSETPSYYYTDLLKNLTVKNCFVIDYGAHDDPIFEPTLNNWFDSTFVNKNKFGNTNLLGGNKRPIPVYIGKEK